MTDDHLNPSAALHDWFDDVTHADWEDVGVAPDVSVPADDALICAYVGKRTLLPCYPQFYKSGAIRISPVEPRINQAGLPTGCKGFHFIVTTFMKGTYAASIRRERVFAVTAVTALHVLVWIVLTPLTRHIATATDEVITYAIALRQGATERTGVERHRAVPRRILPLPAKAVDSSLPASSSNEASTGEAQRANVEQPAPLRR